MPDHKSIYQQQAENYERLVQREDHQHNILEALREITPLEGMEVVELGAGTGRLTTLLASLVRSIRAFDVSAPMLAVAERKLRSSGLTNWQLSLADNRSVPVKDTSADIAISGWSVCYLVDWGGRDWGVEVDKALREMRRVLRPGGVVILLETQGTGCRMPTTPAHLLEYYAFLKGLGFSTTWIRTDYRFESLEEAQELTKFFFGEEMLARIETGKEVTLPECTGFWWMRVD